MIGRLALAAALSAGALGGCRAEAGDRETAQVRRGDVVLGVQVTGQLESAESKELGPPQLSNVWNFKIAFMAPEGADVEEGEPVLKFDVSELRRRLQQKESERDTAAKRLETELATAARNRRDEELAISQAEAELRKAKLKAEVPEESTAAIVARKAKLDLELAEEQLAFEKRKAAAARRRDRAQIARLRDQKRRAQERVETIEQAIAAMTVKAPRAGTVLYVEDWRGDTKKVGDNVWRAHKIIKVVGLEDMEAVGQVDEIDSSKIAVGQPLTLRLDAHPDVELAGELVEISEAVRRKSPENPLKVVDVDVELEPNEEVRLRPGMRFRGRIETGRVEDVLWVPIAAVRATEDGPVVYKKDGGEVRPVPVETGERNRHRVELEGGLAEGDEVVLLDPAAEGGQ